MISRRMLGMGVLAMVAGDGLRRPLNAPSAGGLSPGVQPGVSQPVVVANKVIVFGAGGGVFVYSGTPSPGNLISSDTNATSDPFGNATLSGKVTYFHAGGGVIYALRQIGLQISAYSAPSSAGPFTLISNSLQVFVPSGITVIESGSGAPQGLTSGGVQGALAITQADTTTNTNANLTGAQQLTVSWSVPVGDATAVSTVYEVETDFHGTFENQSLTWSVAIDGTAVVSRAVGAAFFTAGTAFDGYVKGKVQVTATGAGGTVNAFLEGGVGIDGDRSSGINSNSAVISARALGKAFDTTASHTISVTSAWGGSTAGQTISGYGSVFTRKGP